MINSSNDRGDTIIEVLLALTIFTAAVIGVMYVMSSSIGVSQRSLEITQSRTQIDNQIELLRHIHNIALVSSGRSNANLHAAITEENSTPTMLRTWQQITHPSNLISSSRLPKFDSVDTVEKCTPQKVFATIDSAGNTIKNDDIARKAFFIDPVTGEFKKFSDHSDMPATFARIVQNDSGSKSEMIWIFAVKGGVDRATSNSASTIITNYYDFHIRACWQSPVGGGIQRLGTIVRLYEPAR